LSYELVSSYDSPGAVLANCIVLVRTSLQTPVSAIMSGFATSSDCLSQSTNETYTPVSLNVLATGVIPCEYRMLISLALTSSKTIESTAWLPDSENGIVIRSFILTQYRRVTDVQTDGLRDRQKCCSLMACSHRRRGRDKAVLSCRVGGVNTTMHNCRRDKTHRNWDETRQKCLVSSASVVWTRTR